MTQTSEYSPYQKAKKPASKKTPSVSKKTANLIPAYFFWVVLLLCSLGLNIYNVYNRFAPQAVERFMASGVYDFIFSIPGISLFEFLFRIAALAACFLVGKAMYQQRLWTNPIWLMILFVSGFALTVGLKDILLSIPFLAALSIVGLIQYLEILFWNARKKTTMLWCVVVIAYLIEAWMQYDMLPIHGDYLNAWEFIKGIADTGFRWDGFRPVQFGWFLVGLFGIEGGERMVNLVKRHG